ncbi:serine/threonine protein kinase [bacterium]|nr:serine/threonine protein kinase [bacterium]
METIGRYTIQQKLESGKYGDIFIATDPKIGRKVVIKTLKFDRFQDKAEAESLRRRFLREVKQAGKLVHPGIVTIYDVDKTDDAFYVTMEYVEGETLETLLNSHEFIYLPKALAIVEQIAQALEYAHSRGVIHSDISPGCIVLTGPDRIKIMDFGFARYSSPEHVTRAGITVGTPGYMPPEHILSRPIDARSDIFSLGAVFYQLVVGQKPFNGKSVSSIFQKILQVDPPLDAALISHVPQQLVRIINRTLKKDPDERYQSATELLADIVKVKKLVTLVSEKTTFADPKAMTNPPEHSLRRRRERAPTPNRKTPSSSSIRMKQTAIKAQQSFESATAAPGPVTAPDGAILPPTAPVSASIEPDIVTGLPQYQHPGTSLRRSYRSQIFLFSAFMLVCLLFILTVIYLFWGDAAFFIKFLRTQGSQASLEHTDPSIDRLNGATGNGQSASMADGATPHSFEKPPAPTGTLAIRSTPAGARVFIDQILKGTTPLDVPDLALGEHTLSLELEGYEHHTETVRLSESVRTPEIAVTLDRLRFGSINVVADPGASVRLDDQDKGTAPLFIDQVPVGTYTLTLTLNGKTPKNFSVQVEQDATATVKHYFLRPGSLRINAIPFGTAYVDGQNHGITPVYLESIPAGPHVVTIVHDGYKTARQNVIIGEGQDETIFITLEKK